METSDVDGQLAAWLRGWISSFEERHDAFVGEGNESAELLDLLVADLAPAVRRLCAEYARIESPTPEMWKSEGGNAIPHERFLELRMVAALRAVQEGGNDG